MKKKIIIGASALITLILLLVLIVPIFMPAKALLKSIKLDSIYELKDINAKVNLNFVDKDGNPSKEAIAQMLGNINLDVKTKGSIDKGNLKLNGRLKTNGEETPVNLEAALYIKNKQAEVGIVNNGTINTLYVFDDYKKLIGNSQDENNMENPIKEMLNDEKFKNKIEEYIKSEKIKVSSKPGLFKKTVKIEISTQDFMNFIKESEEAKNENITIYIDESKGQIILELKINPYTKSVTDLVLNCITAKGEEGVNLSLEITKNNSGIFEVPENTKRENVKDVSELMTKVQNNPEAQKITDLFGGVMMMFLFGGMSSEGGFDDFFSEDTNESTQPNSNVNMNMNQNRNTNINNYNNGLGNNANVNTNSINNGINRTQNSNVNTTQTQNNNSYYNQNQTQNQNQNRANSNVNNNANGMNSNNYNNGVNTNTNTNTNSMNNVQNTNNNANTQNPNNGIYNYIYGNQ